MKDTQSAFLPGIQGLRAIAVLLVLFYHIWPEALPGGFAGVDVFFVLSGYLITGLLLREAKGGRIDLVAFWARRIRRLLPAATVVLLVSLALSWLLLPETKRLEYSGDILSAALYVVNWRFALSSVDYGHRGAAPSPVQHYWSLSIEEQFYIVWPVMAALIARAATPERQKRVFAVVSFSCLIASFFYSIYFTYSGSAAAYFVSGTRIWELAAGALLASFNIRALSGRLAGLLSWTGLALILVSGFVLKTSMPFPGWLALLPVLGTIFMLLSEQASDWSPAYILKWKPLQYIGDISYSVYLWHWPIVLVLPGIVEKQSFLADGRTLLVFSILAGILSKHIIEDPIRDGLFTAYLQRWRAALFGALLVLITVSASLWLMHGQEEKERLAFEEEQRIVVADADYPGAAALDPEAFFIADPTLPVRPDPLLAKRDSPVLYSDGCELKQTGTAVACEYGNPTGRRTIVLLGDSHAAQYLPALQALAEKHDWRIVVYQKSACMVADSVVRIRSTGMVREDCESWKKEALAAIIQQKPDIVVTSAALPHIYNEYYQLAPTSELVLAYRSLWSRLTDRGIPLLVIRDNPRPLLDVPSCVAMNRTAPGRCSRLREQVLDRHEDPLVEASKTLESSKVHLLDLSHLFCNGQECPAVIGNVLVYRDGDHLTATFARSLSPYIEREMRSILREDQRD